MSVYRYWLLRARLAGAAILTVIISWLLSGALGFPGPGVSHPVAFLQPSPAAALLALGLTLLAGLIVGTLLAGTIRPDAGLLCAAFGWLTLTYRSGPVAQAFFAAPAASTYTRLAIEVLVLGGFLGVGQLVLVALRATGHLAHDTARDGIELDTPGPAQLAGSIFAMTAGYLLLTYFLLATPDKLQVILGCAVAAWGCAAAVHTFFAVDLPPWTIWPGIILGSAAGYLYAGGSMPGLPAIGVVAFPPARALPIDHAAAGVIGALFGYWDARRWRRPSAGPPPHPAALLAQAVIEAPFMR